MVEIRFLEKLVTGENAPYNNKFGEVDSLNKAIDAARAEHARVGGEKEDVDNENVVIIANGDNLWETWEKYARDLGVSWKEFLDSNQHLKEPKTLDGEKQAGWKDWWLVHEGDAVFIPDGPSGSHGPARATADGTNAGPLVKQNGAWGFELTDEAGRTVFHKLEGHSQNVRQNLLYDGNQYRILQVEGDRVTVRWINPNNPNDLSALPKTFDLNEISQ